MAKANETFRNSTNNKPKPRRTPVVSRSHGRIAVIGELNVDLVASGLVSAPVLGREVVADNFHTVLGSASAIFACGIAKLGHSVSFFSKVGNDDYGRFCVHELRLAGISTRHVDISNRVRTGITISLSTRSDRALVTIPGAISQLRYADLDIEALRRHHHLHMTSYFLQAKLRPSFGRILREARKLGMTTSFDPNSDPSSSWSHDIWDVIEEADILFLNEQELVQLTRNDSLQAAFDQLAVKVPCVVVKRGANGAIATSDGKSVAVPGFKISAVDTTGAGDSFAAGFLHGYLRKRALQQCLIEANACGALSAMRVGGTAGQPNVEQLSNFIRRNPPRPSLRNISSPQRRHRAPEANCELFRS